MMNLEEARKVRWLDNYPRPVGDLFDEGYLNRARLEWAVEKARDPRLREAARLLLDALRNPSNQNTAAKTGLPNKSEHTAFPIAVSLEKARATAWPFGAYKGQPMGALVESKELSLKDLAYAVENAWDDKVRQAAIALSLQRLDQVVREPAPSAGFVHLVSGGRSFAERKQMFLMLFEGSVVGFFLGAMLMIGIVGIAETLKPHPNAKSLADFTSTPVGIVALGIVLILVILIIWLENFIPDQLMKRLGKQIEHYRLGQEGEDRVVEIILQALDGNWSLFRNIGLPGRNRGDLDLVLVGPPGVWVLEVKNFRGQYRNVGEKWEYCRGGIWKTASSNPSRQAQNAAVRLKNFLAADNIKIFVNGAVVWANQESLLLVENPSVAVWRYNRLPDELGNVWQGEKLSKVERTKIVEKLSKLCERQNNGS